MHNISSKWDKQTMSRSHPLFFFSLLTYTKIIIKLWECLSFLNLQFEQSTSDFTLCGREALPFVIIVKTNNFRHLPNWLGFPITDITGKASKGIRCKDKELRDFWGDAKLEGLSTSYGECRTLCVLRWVW